MRGIRDWVFTAEEIEAMPLEPLVQKGSERKRKEQKHERL
jgi:hypothetical protein